MSSNLYYLASEYFATGEGMTICLLITRALPHINDYKTKPKFDSETHEYIEGELWYSKEQIAENQFRQTFGGFHSLCLEHFEQEEFFERFCNYIPQHVKNTFESGRIDLGNFTWSSSFHLNLS